MEIQSNKPPTIFLPVIAYQGMVTAEYMLSMIRLVDYFKYNNIAVTYYPITFESLISRARNAAATEFYNEKKYDYLFFIDVDVAFDTSDFIQVFNAKKDVCAGLYPKKYLNSTKMDFISKKNGGFTRDWQKLVTDFSSELKVDSKIESNLIEVNYAATGFMLIKREALDLIVSKFPNEYYKNDIDGYGNKDIYNFFPTGVSDNKYLSEDYGFCKLFKNAGGRIFAPVDTNLSHIGRHTYQGNLLSQFKEFQ